MPRKYKRKLGYQAKRTYDNEFLERAVAAVRRGNMGMRAAAESYGVPYSTLNRKFHGKQTGKYGGQPELSDDEENRLTEVLLLCAEWGFPFKSYDVRLMVQQYLNKLGKRTKRFKDNLPGIDWFKSFLLRHRDLTIKLAENTKRVRAAVSYQIVEQYFTHLQASLEGVPPSNIINYDETNFSDDPGAVKVVVKRGVKHAHRIIDTSKSSTSVMFAITGNGNLLPPYVVYKARHLYPGWTEGGYPGSRYNRTPNGWFDSETFEDWFLTTALPYLRNLEGPKVMIGDNLNSHLTVSVIQQCQNNNIRYVLLPPNSTHMLQPLDVAYFRPFKAAWRAVLEQWKLKNRGVVPKTCFPRLLNETIDKIGAKSETNTLAGFAACGISPYRPDAVLNKIKHLRINPEQEVEQHIEKAWCDTILDRLNQIRTESREIPKRGKKLNVIAGKSVSVADLVPTLTDNGLESGKDQEDYLDEDKLSDDALEISEEEEEINESHSVCSQNVNNDIEIDDFCIVKFSTNKRDRFFVAKIIGKSEPDSEFSVSVLRKKPSPKQISFVYPDVPDISVVQKEQIIQKLSGKLLRRGKYVFQNIGSYCLE